MSKPRGTSVVILITLAELAWLAAFGLLFAYRTKVGELGKVRAEFITATNRLARWEAKAPDAAALMDQVEKTQTEVARLKGELKTFEKLLAGLTPEQAAQRLNAGAEAEKKLTAASKEVAELRRMLEESEAAGVKASETLSRAQSELTKLREKIARLPENIEEVIRQAASMQARVTDLERELQSAQEHSAALAEQMRQKELGEFSVRRELTGLPDGDLRRVVFVVDTSTSMRNSPAWNSARNLVRTWLEFLPVEECALVNFNDDAVGFPKDGYHRVRQSDGTELRAQREQLLKVFDTVKTGTYTDLFRGLKRAYEYPKADVIVLFTDGHPHVDYQTDAAFAKNIYGEVAKHPGVPILTVALGSYEIEGAGGPRPRTNAPVGFLKELSRISGGNFQGR